MESREAVAIPQTLRLRRFRHAGNMPRTRHYRVNENSFKIGVNSRNFVRFYPLSWEKTVLLVLWTAPPPGTRVPSNYTKYSSDVLKA